jgi:two-component system NtrC family sensor kinase
MAAMGTRAADCDAMKKRRRTTTKPKRRTAPKVLRRRISPGAGLRKKVALLTRERDEALQQQTATADVLKVISRSTFDLQTVLDTLIETAAKLCEAHRGVIFRRDGDDSYHGVAFYNASPELVDFIRRHPITPGRHTITARVALERRAIHVADLQSDAEYRYVLRDDDPIRTELGVPMFRGDDIVGIFILYKLEVHPFTDKQIELVQNFAAQAVIAIENTRLLNELRESLEQQTATSEVLRVISSSPGELKSVFDAMLANATRLCDASYGTLWLHEGDGQMRAAALHGGLPEAFLEKWGVGTAFRPSPIVPSARAMRSREPVQLVDLKADQSYVDGDALAVAAVQVAGIRSIISVPMVKDDVAVGAMTIYRREVRPFTDKQIALVANFAAQAVIAIENARLLNELRQRTTDLSESLEQQTATSEVLKVISSSPGNLEPVFQAMLENATRICEAKFGTLFRFDGNRFCLEAQFSSPPALVEAQKTRGPFPPTPGTLLDRVVRTKQVSHSVDYAAEPVLGLLATLGGARSTVSVPMLKDDELIGAFTIYRQEVRPFTDKQIELVKNFAAQAVIAIENTRLLNELRQRTDDLTESLEQQTATSEVLRVISSSPGELEPVFQAMLENATRICDATFGVLYRYGNETFDAVAHFGVPPALAEFNRHRRSFQPDAGTALDRLLRTKEVVRIADDLAAPTPSAPSKFGGARTLAVVPMLKENVLVGAISISRQEVRPFTDKQIALVQNFAAQAVIAIENTRLLNELRQSLAQQTATADVLKVISRSTFDLPSVLNTLVESAAMLCRADKAQILLPGKNAHSFYAAASYGHTPEYNEYLSTLTFEPSREGVVGRVLLERKPVQIADVLADPEYRLRETQRLGGFRTHLGLPLLREGNPIGILVVSRATVEPFEERHIELLTTFADQAVIAIENVRLFEAEQERTRELSEALEHQTATSEVLNVISRSPTNAKPVFDAICESASRLCDGAFSVVWRYDGDLLHYVASQNFTPEVLDRLFKTYPKRPDRSIAAGRAILDGKIAHVPDMLADPTYAHELALAGNWRASIAVPMLRNGKAIGVISVGKAEAEPFSERQKQLLTTFADQAVIAVENARLFEAEQQRTRELTRSLEDLRAAQDRLVQTEKLASLGQLTAGIAHEIKNPLNFVNNFSAVSVELIDELRDALGGAHLDSKLRQEIGEIADTLQGNLDKVVQHGKRADAIVKNMLLHSRQGSGEQRSVDINALVEESLNLAYHGARAEKQGFNVTLARSFDPAAGAADLFPQEITRVLLNLIANGFYAANRRKTEANGGNHEPTVTAATKNLGDRVEIRIHDNGTGIPPEVKEQMFNPFFTTKPAGEGTGLGLSISHDIIVKQHGGSIEVDTRPGEFTEFRIVLPRAGASHMTSGEPA